MTDVFKAEYPTWGDLAREQLRRRGAPYFADVQSEIRTRLDHLSPAGLKAFALTCAERLMRQHEELPRSQRRVFTLQWRPVLDAIWTALETGNAESIRVVSDAAEALRKSPFDHNEGQNGPEDAHEDAAAASIAAAECFLTPNQELAYLASSRAIDKAFRRAEDELQLDPNDFVWDPNAEPMPLAKEAMHPFVQAELSRQLSDLSSLEESPVNFALLQRLKNRGLPGG